MNQISDSFVIREIWIIIVDSDILDQGLRQLLYIADLHFCLPKNPSQNKSHCMTTFNPTSPAKMLVGL